MKSHGEFEECEVDCEECGETFLAPGAWDVESYDICTTRREWFPEDGYETCDECKSKVEFTIVITLKAEDEEEVTVGILEDNVLLTALIELMAIPAAHIKDITVKKTED